MFNLGSDDKEDLQENMKEIKNLIDNGGSEEPAQNQGTEDAGFGDSPQSNQGAQGNSSNQFEQNVRQNAQQEGNNSQNNDGFGQDLGSNEQGSSLQSDQGQQQAGNDLGGQESSRPAKSNLAGNSPSGARQPSGDKVINEEENNNESNNDSESESPERPSGNEPLFLREEQFTDIREMIEEMSYLTQEMGQKVDRMKKTVRDERDTSKDSSELVEAFNQRRAKIESTIESGQN